MSDIIRANGPHAFGYTEITRHTGDMLMDFGILRLRKGESWTEEQPLEKAYLLVYGEVRFDWDNETHTEIRTNCFDVPPTALHASKATKVTITCLSEDCEANVLRTVNESIFPAKLYLP